LVSAVTFAEVMEHVAQAFEALGAFALSVGTLWSFLLAGLAWRRSGQGRQAFAVLRQALGGTLLLSVEILVAADLIRTIAVAPTVENVLTLGLIVLIRTFLSFSLEIEISGTVPWRRGLMTGPDALRQSSASVPKRGGPDQPPDHAR
jgi:uncharacterized membrane protein